MPASIIFKNHMLIVKNINFET